jgi:hypothetical protein
VSLTRKKIPSPNYSAGRNGKPRLIVLHTAEGSRTIESLGRFFASRSAEASSHAGADDTPNTIGEYVARSNRAWTQAAYNGTAVSIELCAFARWPLAEWEKHPILLSNVAKWIAEEAAYFGIPIKALTPMQAQGASAGVCQHKDLGAAGGGHSDCGPNFPMGKVLDMARSGGAAPAQTQTWYFLQDIAAVRLARGQRQYYGGWASAAVRKEKLDALEKGYNHRMRPFSDPDFLSSFFIDNSAAVKEIYGGWLSEDSVEAQQEKLEKKLGRKLRRFSEKRTKSQGGVPWGCKNLATP